MHLELVLVRHIDGPKDSREGYHCTYIYWIKVVAEAKDGIRMVYHIAFILYSRNTIGNAVDKEPAMEKRSIT